MVAVTQMVAQLTALAKLAVVDTRINLARRGFTTPSQTFDIAIIFERSPKKHPCFWLYLTRSRLRIFQIAEILDLEAFSLGL